MTRRTCLLALVILSAVTHLGCGYSLAGRGNFLPSYIRTVGIPMFVNNSTVFDLEQMLTQRVRTEFIGRGRYQVLPQIEGADAVLNGTIVAVNLEPSGFDQNNRVTRYNLRITLKLEFRDVKANKIIWENPSQQFDEEYDLSTSATPADSLLTLDQTALDRVSTDVARRTVSAILEAF